ncbi:MAG: hypothetical protein LBL26_12605 [Peptococcaceae bacterium]|jgi:uncharacterized protein YkwD|nr:hypothetical protein [Peptococcaceae bacterium]
MFMIKHTRGARAYIFAAAILITLSIGAAAFAGENNKKNTVTIDGRAVSFAHPVYAENPNVYVPADDVFGYYGYDKQTDDRAHISAYRSNSNFFTVDHNNLALKINGIDSAAALKAVGQVWYINAKDLARIIPLTAAYQPASGSLKLTTQWETEVVEFLDDIKAFPITGSFGFSKGKAWIGIYTLPNALPESDVWVNPGSLEINSPIDGSYTKFNFNGTVEYRAAGAARSAVGFYDKTAMLAGSGDNLRLNVDLISSYSSYTITTEHLQTPGKPLYYIHVKSAWNSAGQTGPEVVILDDSSESVPLGSGAAAEKYEPPLQNIHPNVRDSGHILNTALMDGLAAEINRFRARAGLSTLTVNHSLVYKKQNQTPGRTTAFDNLRWCREHLSGRTLEHIVPAVGMGEILMSEFETGVSAAMIVNMWNASPTHRAVMMHPGQKSLGICVIQYPNGDQDAVGVFTMNG